MTSCWKDLDHLLNNGEGLTQWAFVPLGQHITIQLQTWITWGTYLKAINIFILTGSITKTWTLAKIFHKTAGEANLYVWFGYSPLTIYNNTLREVSVSMNSYPINLIHTSKQSAKQIMDKKINKYLYQAK